jgi:(1->4)-alpha-D-glucan 1-alpha-D-glucosylmutase
LKVPLATYRIQLNKNFPFSSLKAIVPYLSQLGISHIYASPIFQAEKDSIHGYNVIDPDAINQELGGKAGFEDVIREAEAYGLGWLQDIVPNHASYTPQNKRLNDVLAKGAGSAYACFFDVNWNHPSEKLQGKLLLPILAEPYIQCLKQGQIRLVHNGGFKIKYGNLEFPVNVATTQHLELNGSVQQTLEEYNRNPKYLDALLSKQYYRLAHWKTAFRHISYRRFFDINGLIGVRMENPDVFEEWHRLVFELMWSGVVSGLRVDHIDGLYAPEVYLQKLRDRCRGAYLVVEKILAGEEQLPKTWPVEGTTGYDFLNYANKLFIQSANEPAFSALYRDFTSNTQAFDDLLYDAKKTVAETYFLGDARNIARLFSGALRESVYTGQFDHWKLTVAVVELMACFSLYRTYLNEQSGGDTAFWTALKLAEQQNPPLAAEFSAITRLLKERRTSPDALHALKRFQQFTGAVMAKGFEDTVLYRYSRLLSLNEVGSSPAQFGISIEQFHEFNRIRQRNWPLTLNASSTHDTKRGEDVRARLNVLSEVPDDFRTAAGYWAELNAAKKRQINGAAAPDGSEEYYLYQTLLGAYPWDDGEKQNFSERIRQHMVKVLREAKVHSSWIEPNLPYEEAAAAFAELILTDDAFMDAFLPLQNKTAICGVFNSLAQTLLKAVCPGVPDFYQGTELWDLNLVDPDNRRPVNFELRQKLLSEIAALKPQNAHALLQTPGDGKVKLYAIFKTLQFRRKHRLLFEGGAYLPLAIKGAYAACAVAFCRKRGDAYVAAVVPRCPASLLYTREGRSVQRDSVAAEAVWSGADWADTYISLPEGTPARWTDVFTDETVLSSCGRLYLRDVLDAFPVALLFGDEYA